jgi:hypothetical protein
LVRQLEFLSSQKAQVLTGWELAVLLAEGSVAQRVALWVALLGSQWAAK